MQDLAALRTLTKKLDEIKESWQIYAIFEDARKAFNVELDALKKDKEALIESFNATSAKNAILLAQNKELEAKNQSLQTQNRALESLKENSTDTEKMQNIESQNVNHLDNLETYAAQIINDLNPLYTQCQTLQETLKSIQEIFTAIPPSPKPLPKLIVTYQQHQRVKANPAENYVHLELAEEFFSALEYIESKVKTLDLEADKLSIEIRDMLQIHTKPQNLTQNSTQELDISDDTDSIKDNA